MALLLEILPEIQELDTEQCTSARYTAEIA